MDPVTIGVFSGFVAILLSVMTAVMLHLDKKVDRRLERVENRLERVENRLERIEEHLGKLALAVAELAGVVGGSKGSPADAVAAAGAGATTG